MKTEKFFDSRRRPRFTEAVKTSIGGKVWGPGRRGPDRAAVVTESPLFRVTFGFSVKTYSSGFGTCNNFRRTILFIIYFLIFFKKDYFSRNGVLMDSVMPKKN